MNRPELDSLFEVIEPHPPARSRPSGRRSAPDASSKPLGSWENLRPWQPLPRWTRCVDGGSVDQTAFAAGAALFALDPIVRADPAWLGAFRMRQALTAAAASTRLLRRREDEAELRDAHHLPSDDPGPAGRLHRAWRTLANRPTRLDHAALDRLAGSLGLDPISSPGPLLERIETAKGSPVVAAASAARAIGDIGLGREGEIFGLMLADMVLAMRFGWAIPVPLLATAIIGLKTADGRRPRPGEPGWAIACHAALARAAADAHARQGETSRRAERLIAVAGQVRTRGGDAGILALLGDDAVAATALKTLGSARAARRFLARLVELGAIRELTGRETFRLYGL